MQMLTFSVLILSVVSILLALLFWQTQQRVNKLQLENEYLRRQLIVALERLAAADDSKLSKDGLLDKVVRGLVALGVPGLVCSLLLPSLATQGQRP
jgi:hypothetical protein